jgi:hypothetical protein
MLMYAYPVLNDVDVRWFHDDMLAFAFRFGAIAMCFGLVASIAMFHLERKPR